VAIAALGCGVLSQEEQLLTRFFEAARLHDTTVMAKYATVTFNPVAQGVIHAFDVDSVEAIDEVSKRVTVLAQLRRPDGQITRRSLVVTMRREDGAWMITEIQ
jgi:hypothetical protein